MRIQPINQTGYTKPNFQGARYRILCPAVAASIFLVPGLVNQYIDKQNYKDNVSPAINEYTYDMETEKKLLIDNNLSTNQFMLGIKNAVENSDKAPDILKSMRKAQNDYYKKLDESALQNIESDRQLLYENEQTETPDNIVVSDLIKDEELGRDKVEYAKKMDKMYETLISGQTNDFEYTNTAYNLADMYINSNRNDNYLKRLIGILESSHSKALEKMSDSEKQKIADEYDNKINEFKDKTEKAYKAPREYHHLEGTLVTIVSFLLGFFGDKLRRKDNEDSSYDTNDNYGEYFYT